MAGLVVLETGAGPVRERGIVILLSSFLTAVAHFAVAPFAAFGDVILFFIHIIRIRRDSRQSRLRGVHDSSRLDSYYFTPPNVPTKDVGANCERFIWTSRLQICRILIDEEEVALEELWIFHVHRGCQEIHQHLMDTELKG